MKTNTLTLYDACLLHARADRAVRLVVGRELAPYNITMMQWLLLVTVQRGDSKGVRMTALAEALAVTMPQITALMNDLTKLKLVKQKINNTDRRSRFLVISEAGTKMLGEIETTLNAGLQLFLKDISDEHVVHYLNTISHITSDVTAKNV